MINPSGAEAVVFRGSATNIIAADDVVPGVARPSVISRVQPPILAIAHIAKFGDQM